jgi:hypothetical protein
MQPIVAYPTYLLICFKKALKNLFHCQKTVDNTVVLMDLFFFYEIYSSVLVDQIQTYLPLRTFVFAMISIFTYLC